MCPGSPTTSLKSFDEIFALLLKRAGKPENSKAKLYDIPG